MRKLAIFTAAFVLAAAAYIYKIADTWALWLAAGALLVSILLRLGKLRAASIFCLGAAVSLVWCSFYQQIFLMDAFSMDGTEQPVTVQISEVPYETNYGTVHCKLSTYEAVLYADEALLRARPGDTVSCTAYIEVKEDDVQLRSDGTVLCLYAKENIHITKGTPNLPQRLRMWLQGKIDALYAGESAGLVKALLTGDRSGLSYETTNALSVSGLSHAVAVSGMHVSILLTMVAMLCGYQPRLMALFGIPVVLIFALMTGASPSVCRAAVMQIMLLLAPIVRRERDNVTTLAAAALVLLVQNPWCIASISFQLSFAAVGGLMLFSGPMQTKILTLKKKPGKILRVIASAVSATLSASLTTIPLTVFYFGIVSIAAPLTNLLVLWAVTGVFTLGLSSCCLGALGAVPAFAATVLTGFILKTAKVIASVPYAAAYPQNVPLMIWGVAFYFFLAAVLLFRNLSVRWLICVVTAGFILCTVPAHIRFTSKPWQLTALDVGQGQCLVLQIEDFTAVIDCGGSNPQDAGEKAARYLHSAGITHVDCLILTHYDADHAGGAEQFLSRIRTDAIYVPNITEQHEIAVSIMEQTQPRTVEELTKITLPMGKLTLYPPVSNKNDNNSGVCVLMTAGEYDMLITGDLDAMAEMRLMSSWELPDVELLVAGHHGAKSSTSQVLLDNVRPETVIISVGRDNSHGHPSEETLNRLQHIGAKIIRTDMLGDIIIHP